MEFYIQFSIFNLMFNNCFNIQANVVVLRHVGLVDCGLFVDQSILILGKTNLFLAKNNVYFYLLKKFVENEQNNIISPLDRSMWKLFISCKRILWCVFKRLARVKKHPNLCLLIMEFCYFVLCTPNIHDNLLFILNQKNWIKIFTLYSMMIPSKDTKLKDQAKKKTKKWFVLSNTSVFTKNKNLYIKTRRRRSRTKTKNRTELNSK